MIRFQVVLDQSGKIVSYGTIRIVRRNKLSAAPFYADTLEAAEVLLKDLINNIPNWQQYEKIGFLYPGIAQEKRSNADKKSCQIAGDRNSDLSYPYLSSGATTGRQITRLRMNIFVS
uniref:Uncharacterized protein n=1 Tax=Caenorhabditis japonica TaxID=281687 RepID=A0A8R1E3J5_CAEJA